MNNNVKNMADSSQQDLLNRAAFLSSLESYLETEQRIVDGSLVIGLGAPFGAGKTTFIEMWKRKLAISRDAFVDGVGPRPPLVVGINAWESDYHADPLAVITLSVIESLKGADDDAADRITKSFEKVARFLSGGFRAVVNNYVAGATGGFDCSAAFGPGSGAALSNPVVSELIERKKCMAEVKDALRAACGGEGIRTYIFVDELDRCRPDFAIAYLEVIKHLFDIKGVVFILAVDVGQLESAAKSVFGTGLNFQEYFRKFVHRSISLPSLLQLRTHDRTAFVESYFKKYLRIQVGSRDARYLIEMVQDFLSVYEVPLRGFQEVLRVMAHARYRQGVSPESINHIDDVRLFLMSFLRVVSLPDYRKFGLSVHSFEGLDEIIMRLSRLDHYRQGDILPHRFSILAHGFNLSSSDANHALEERLGKYFTGSPVEMKARFDSVGRGWSKYAEIYQRIESLLSIE
jgi:hypothetical protein